MPPPPPFGVKKGIADTIIMRMRLKPHATMVVMEARADRFVAVLEGGPPRLAPKHGLHGSVCFAPQRRRKSGRWWVVFHVRHAESKQLLTQSELRARIPLGLSMLKDSTTNARSVQTFMRNLRRAEGYVRVEASAI
jgi:hypothetical protein